MSFGRNFAAAVVVLAFATGISGCSGAPAPSAETTTPTSGERQDSGVRLTKGTLPAGPGYAWDMARYGGGQPIPVQMTVAGPWTLTAGSEWPVSTSEIVASADVPGIDAFKGFDFVVKAPDGGLDYYYPRQMTDEWMLQIGKITVNGADVAAEPYNNPLRLWPMDFKVGDTFVVSDGGSFKIDATVLAQNTVTVPAGTIDDAYLLRFQFTPLAEGALEGTQYYILAPGVGFVALFSVATGDEANGFTALASEQVLVTLPEKR